MDNMELLKQLVPLMIALVIIGMGIYGTGIVLWFVMQQAIKWVAYAFQRIKLPYPSRRYGMQDDARGAFLKQNFQDKTVEWIEDQYYNNLISADERRLYYKWAGNSMGMKDFLQKGEASVCETDIMKRHISNGGLIRLMRSKTS